MLAIFKVNDPYRILLVLVFIFFYRWIIFFNFPELIIELKWIILGETLNQNQLMYTEVLDNTPPLIAGLYWFIFNFFGHNTLPYHLSASLLVVVQAFIFNQIMIKHRCFLNNSYVPALIYCIIASLHIEMLTLSPTLVGLTFLLIGLNHTLQHIKERNRDVLVLFIGFYFGIAQLCFSSFSFFIIAVILYISLFIGNIFRWYILLILGFIFPQIILVVYFFLKNGLQDYIYIYYNELIEFSFFNAINSTIFYVMFLPTLIFIYTLNSMFKRKYYTNIQIQFQLLMIFLFIASLTMILLYNHKSIHHLSSSVPFLSFFVCIFFLRFRRFWIAELLFIVFLVVSQFILIIPVKKDSFMHDDLVNKIVNKEKVLNLKNKSILNFTQEYEVFKSNIPSSKFFNTKLSRKILHNRNNYENLITIYQTLYVDQPELIISALHEPIDDLEQKLPTIFKHYKKQHNDEYIIYEKAGIW